MPLKAGAILEAQETNGFTAQMFAAAHNPITEVVTNLLRAGADLKAQDRFGLTALINAARSIQSPHVVTALLKAGASAKAIDAGKAAFDYARESAKLKDADAFQELKNASQ